VDAMGCCKCCPPIISVFETEISNDIIIPEKLNSLLPILPKTDIDELKDKVICEYLKVLSQLE